MTAIALPDPPADRDPVAVELWLALYDRWSADMERRLLRDEIAAATRWAALERPVVASLREMAA